MSQLSSFLKDASILKNYIPGERISVAVRGNSQIFSASSNVVKAAPIYQQQNFFKLLNISSCPPFKVTDLILNHNETLLAVVGASHVGIVDVKDHVDFDSPEPVWNCFNVSISLPETSQASKKPVIKQVLWHPASSRHSQLVVLTETDILLYDIVFSLTSPMLTLPLRQFSQLQGKTVSSITFGSSVNFAGSITLYLSTENGSIYAIYPFTYKSSAISTTKSQLANFVSDWHSCLQSYEERLPPAAAFASYRAIFNKHSAFVDKIEAILRSPICAEATKSQALSFNYGQDDSLLEFFGPLANTGPGAKLISTDANDDVSVLASIHRDSSGNVIISHLSQIIPLVISITEPSRLLTEPTKPVRQPKQPKDTQYSRPTRGFGFVVDLDDEDDQEDEDFEIQMRAYMEELGYYKERQKINAFVDSNFNKLTVLATDATDLAYARGTVPTFSKFLKSKFLVASGPSLLIGDLTQAAARIFDTEITSFEVYYKLLEMQSAASSFAYVKDTTEASGDYLMACSSSHDTGVFKLENTKKLIAPPAEKTPSSSVPQDTPRLTLPAEELSLLKAECDSPLPSAKSLDPTQFESLELVHRITSDSVRKVGALTKFLLALQTKLEIQFEELRHQTNELLSVKNKAAVKDNHNQNYDRIQKLFSRQEELIEREKTMRSKIVERFEKVKAGSKLPLSQAERDWFKELNSITKTVAYGDGKTPSMTSRLEKLRAEVSNLVEKKNEPSEDKLNDMLSSLSLDSSLSRMAYTLLQEGEVLAHSKDTIDHCLERLQKSLPA
ncbi:hypothetical protein OY671_003212 [Metschnikowia pulcherrima]|nr:hypothetical protein OY671_003212 [Metschnikowia pulcherrima]